MCTSIVVNKKKTIMSALSDADGNVLHIVPGQGSSYYEKPEYRILTNFSPYKQNSETHPDNFGYTGAALPVVLKDCLPMMVIGIFPNIISAMGEEIGWRGYMLPAITKRSSPVKALIVTGLFWACWHLPLLAFGDYMTGAPVWYKLPAFVLCILPVGIIIGSLTYMSNSIWPAAFLHAAHNNFDQAVFGVITRGDDMMYYVSETGFLTIICAWLIAIIIVRILQRRSDFSNTCRNLRFWCSTDHGTENVLFREYVIMKADPAPHVSTSEKIREKAIDYDL